MTREEVRIRSLVKPIHAWLKCNTHLPIRLCQPAIVILEKFMCLDTYVFVITWSTTEKPHTALSVNTALCWFRSDQYIPNLLARDGGTLQLPWQPPMSPLRRASICPYPLLQDHSTYITLASRGVSQTVCAIDCFSNLPGRELELWVGNFLSMSSLNCRDAWMPWWWYKSWVFICKICQNSLIVNMPLADVTYKISCQKGLFWE